MNFDGNDQTAMKHVTYCLLSLVPVNADTAGRSSTSGESSTTISHQLSMYVDTARRPSISADQLNHQQSHHIKKMHFTNQLFQHSTARRTKVLRPTVHHSNCNYHVTVLLISHTVYTTLPMQVFSDLCWTEQLRAHSVNSSYYT